MADKTKYGIYFITEPIELGPVLHIRGDDYCCGLQFPGFPVEV